MKRKRRRYNILKDAEKILGKAFKKNIADLAEIVLPSDEYCQVFIEETFVFVTIGAMTFSLSKEDFAAFALTVSKSARIMIDRGDIK